MAEVFGSVIDHENQQKPVVVVVVDAGSGTRQLDKLLQRNDVVTVIRKARLARKRREL